MIGGILAIKQIWIPYLNAGNAVHQNISSDPFDGAILPILYIPDWSKSTYQNKTTTFADIPLSDYIPLPKYDRQKLLNGSDISRENTILKYTYITPFMGSYRLNYKEHDGSHNGVDIRAPIGTPVVAMANAIVVRTVQADSTGNRFVVLRHDGVMYNGKIQDLYSGYLHLSEITVTEGQKIRKGDMIGRVGISGLATTPHLHFQIDTENAPFHPYWPFTSSDSRAAGLSFYDSVDAGLGRERALEYNIHPIEFIASYGNNNQQNTTPTQPTTTQVITPPSPSQNEYVAVNTPLESISSNNTSTKESTTIVKANVTQKSQTSCEKKRFYDIPTGHKISKTLYKIIDEKCVLQSEASFRPNATITQREAIMLIMDYYKITPTNGESHFLDIPLGDSFHGYASVAERRGILLGSHARPDKMLSKEDFIELLVKIGKFEKNPSQIQIYKDASPMNLKYSYIQDYGFKIRARGGNFQPQSLITRSQAIEILGQIYNKENVAKK